MTKIPKYLVKQKVLQNKHERNKLSKTESVFYDIILFMLFGWIIWLIIK